MTVGEGFFLAIVALASFNIWRESRMGRRRRRR